MGAAASHPHMSLAHSINSFGNQLFDKLAAEVSTMPGSDNQHSAACSFGTRVRPAIACGSVGGCRIPSASHQQYHICSKRAGSPHPTSCLPLRTHALPACTGDLPSHPLNGACHRPMAHSLLSCWCPAYCLQSQEGKEQDAIFLSPFGISQALAMLLNGVEPGGESYKQLQVGPQLQGRCGFSLCAGNIGCCAVLCLWSRASLHCCSARWFLTSSTSCPLFLFAALTPRA